MQIANGQFLQGDCLELMKDIPDGIVDMVLCDLPYGTTACSWDSIIPFEPLWEQYWRVCKPNAAIVLTASQPFTSALVMSQPRYLKYELIWAKGSGSSPGVAKYRPLPSHESVLVFGKGKTTYNPQMRKGFQPWTKRDTGKELKNEHGFGYGNKVIHKSGGGERYPLSVISEVPQVKGHGRQIHPTQKPVALFEYLIRTYTNPGELVLDNTAGSGTTAVAAERSGRRWICIERDPDYYLQACARVLDL